MASTIKLNGRIYQKGDVLTLNKEAPGLCRAPAGLRVQIMFIRDGSAGLYSPDQRVDHWSDLDGEVDDNRGWWIGRRELERCIKEFGDQYEIASQLKHRGVELEGMPCRSLAGLEDGSIFVEFDEDVNGCSADGLGKSGYCVAVNTKFLKRKKREKHAQ